ncbi:MAG: sulfotransferase [Deltaproteobacteria bacterium]|nr:sulfotransferase [Deltaproteobacteria bacterium]
MAVRMLFVIGAPRSGTTMLERMLSSHSMIQGGPEPHLLTPLAHLGVWAKVDKAPYDHVLAAESQKLFVSRLPRGEADYWEACRAYCDVLYGRFLEANGGRAICLDKTPAYALVLPFLAKVFPDARYVVLTRHPLAIFSSYANSFFDGDYRVAHDYNPILERYVPAMAAFLRGAEVPQLHVRYEDLVTDPEAWFRRICEHVGIPFEAEAIDYGKQARKEPREGLGDPIGVQQHSRPSTASLDKWPRELAADPAKLALMREVLERLAPDDLETLGYPVAEIWKPMEGLGPEVKPPKPPKATRYRFRRRMIVRLRSRARKGGPFRRLLEKLRLGCDVLLREQ